ncbi:MAG TPA: porin [Candidatus Limnocylindrales bacterium]|nr:porin [Candidatus Limnocylindrales bacterium]
MTSRARACRVVAVILVSLALANASARAGEPVPAPGSEPTTAELLRRIEALEKEVAELRGAGRAPEDRNTHGSAAPAQARRIQGAGGHDESAAAPAVEAPAVAKATGGTAKPTAGYDDGFFVSSGDGAYKLRINGYVQADGRFFADSDIRKNVDQFVIRRARLDLRAKLWKRYIVRIAPDFAGSDLSLKYAYIETDFSDAFMLRVGKYKTPFGIEQLESSTALPFAERALPDNIVPGRDIGVELFGDPTGGRLSYTIAVLNGVPDGGNGDGDVNDAVDIAARLFATPYAPSPYSPLRGAGFGIAGTWGREQGSTSSPQLPSYKTSGRTTFFSYEDDGTKAGTTIADGDRWRISPQASWYEGPFGLLTEYVRSSQRLSRDGDKATVDNQAWQIRTSWILTGERASPERVDPAYPFDFGGGHWGAWQLALRWSSLDVDAAAFRSGFADPSKSARHADAIAAAINWYLNHNVSVYLDYEHTMFGGGDGSGDRVDEDLFLTRMQLEF